METEGRIMAHRCRRARNGLLQAQLLSQLPGLHITTQLTAVLGKHSRCTAQRWMSELGSSCPISG